MKNSLIYKANKVKAGKNIFVTIRLNDECKNGHQDFAITANIYEAGKPTTDRNMISGGCCHEDILKAFPEFKIFVDLHLCDYLGNPIYATANGYYHLREGFNNVKVNTSEFKTKFCEYYRITPKQFDKLNTAESKTHYAILLMELNIPKQWKEQADKAIEYLEVLTNEKFLVDSVKNQFGMPSEEEIKEETAKIKNSYYSDSAKAERLKEANNKFILEIQKEAQNKINKINKELELKIELFKIGGKRILESAIYYDHTNTISFNWRGYGETISKEEAENVFNQLNTSFKHELSLEIK